VNPTHERRARDLLAARIGVPISISFEVSPQMREFEPANTVCANAYVRPRECGPADGAVFTADCAHRFDLPQVLSPGRSRERGLRTGPRVL
jgi:hypothetical protein